MKAGIEKMDAANVKNVSLVSFDVVAKAAAEMGYIKPEDEKKLLAFRDNPSDESWMEA